MRRTVLAQLRHRPARYVATALAICLGSGFLTAALLFTQVLQRALGDAFTADTRGADVVVTAGSGVGRHAEGSLSAAELARVTGVRGVATGLVLRADPASATLPRIGRTTVSIQPVAADPRLRWQSLTAGTWPRDADQALLDSGTAGATGLGVGSTIGVSALDDHGRPRPARRVRIAGIADITGNLAPAGTGPTLFVPDRSLAAGGASRVDLVAADGDPAALRDAVTATLRADGIVATARTAADNRAAVLASFATLTRVLSAFVLASALLALCVAGLVVANTFAILLTQRTRELALLRCLGAGTSQVFRAVLAEATVLGAAAGALGVAGGYGAVAAAVAIGTRAGLPIALPQVAPAPSATALPILAAVALTVAAAGSPARRATRVAPVAALRPDGVPTAGGRLGLLRIATGGVAILAGSVILAAGEVLGASIGLLAVTAGGLLAFVGLLVAAPLFVPVLARVLGVAVSRVARLTGRLATANVARNPARAGATCSALVIGVALVSVVAVGAASGKASLLVEVRGSTPVDVSVGQGGSYLGVGETAGRTPVLPAALAARVARGPGVTGVAALSSVPATGRLPGGTRIGGTVQGIDPAALALVTRGQVSRLDGSTIVLGAYFDGSDDATPADGQRLPLTVAGHTRVFHVRTDPALPIGAVVSSATLAAMGAPTGPTDLWVRTGALDPGGDVDAVGAAVAGVRTAVGATVAAEEIARVRIDGPGEQAATFLTVIDRLVDVLGGLLAVTVLIAFVGIANTLSLSVLERGRENALLRALGLTRGRLRAVVAWEAVTLALVGAVLGVVAGSLLGFAGTRAVLTGASSGRVSTLYRLPLGSLGGVIALAVLAGLAASVLPARRAVRTAPAATLAED